jgi:hypothetical protein
MIKILISKIVHLTFQWWKCFIISECCRGCHLPKVLITVRINCGGIFHDHIYKWWHKLWIWHFFAVQSSSFVNLLEFHLIVIPLTKTIIIQVLVTKPISFEKGIKIREEHELIYTGVSNYQFCHLQTTRNQTQISRKLW